MSDIHTKLKALKLEDMQLGKELLEKHEIHKAILTLSFLQGRTDDGAMTAYATIMGAMSVLLAGGFIQLKNITPQET